MSHSKTINLCLAALTVVAIVTVTICYVKYVPGQGIPQSDKEIVALRRSVAILTETKKDLSDKLESARASLRGSEMGQTETGVIEGSLSFPSEIIPSLLTCAENRVTEKVYCTSEVKEDAKYDNNLGYQIVVPVGEYVVFSQVFEKSNFVGYYSGEGVEENMMDFQGAAFVKVNVGETTTKIDTNNWYNNN